MAAAVALGCTGKRRGGRRQAGPRQSAADRQSRSARPAMAPMVAARARPIPTSPDSRCRLHRPAARPLKPVIRNNARAAAWKCRDADDPKICDRWARISRSRNRSGFGAPKRRRSRPPRGSGAVSRAATPPAACVLRHARALDGGGYLLRAIRVVRRPVRRPAEPQLRRSSAGERGTWTRKARTSTEGSGADRPAGSNERAIAAAAQPPAVALSVQRPDSQRRRLRRLFYRR